MSENNTPDQFAQLESMMGNIPGGSYFLAMLRNNPDAQEALRSIDPSRPDSMREGMRRLLGVFGMTGAAADQMIGQAMTTMQDPVAMKKAAEQYGVPINPSGFAATPPLANEVPSVPNVAPNTNAGPPWIAMAQRASRLISDGSERAAFDQMTAALDDPSTAEYDPRATRFGDLTDLLDVFATEVVAAGRQVPPRFATLYQRAAFHVGFTPTDAPPKNPEFSSWCIAIARAIQAHRG